MSAQPKVSIEEIQAQLDTLPESRWRRVSLPRLCAAFIVLQRNGNRLGVAEALGVSPQSVSHLAHCLAGKHYALVRKEYERLGPDEFLLRYWDQELFDRVTMTRMRLQSTPRGRPRSKYESHAGEYRLFYHSEDIGLLAISQTGGDAWRFSVDGEADERRFRTSKQAFDAALSLTGADDSKKIP